MLSCTAAHHLALKALGVLLEIIFFITLGSSIQWPVGLHISKIHRGDLWGANGEFFLNGILRKLLQHVKVT